MMIKKILNIRFDKSYALMTTMKTIGSVTSGSVTSFGILIYKQIKALEYCQMYNVCIPYNASRLCEIEILFFVVKFNSHLNLIIKL